MTGDGNEDGLQTLRVRIHKSTDRGYPTTCGANVDLMSCLREHSHLVELEADFSVCVTSSIGVITMSSPSIERYSQYSEYLTANWAHKWGYDMVVAELDEDATRARHIIWDKVSVLGQFLPYYRYLFYYDADALPTDFESPWFTALLSQFPEKDLLICRDSAGIAVGGAYVNAGVMVLRNSSWTRRFLGEWWRAGETYDVYKQFEDNVFVDQGALGQLILDHSQDNEWTEHIHVCPPETFNNRDPFYLTHPKGNAPVLHLENHHARVREQVFRHIYEGFREGLPFMGIEQQWMQQIVHDEARHQVLHNPEDANAWHRLSNMLIEQDDYEGAIAAIQHAIQLNSRGSVLLVYPGTRAA